MGLYEHFTSGTEIDRDEIHDLENKLLSGGWLHAWNPDRFPSQEGIRRSFHFSLRDSTYDRDKDLAPALEFLKKKLLSADPTTDKRYFKYLCKFSLALWKYQN
jgi:hypothetical protein